jgi:hypothetical protein
MWLDAASAAQKEDNMPYILAADGTLQPDTRKFLNMSSSKRDLFDALSIQVTRAESAEARAAQLEADNKELARKLEQACLDLAEYRKEVERLTRKVMTS